MPLMPPNDPGRASYAKDQEAIWREIKALWRMLQGTPMPDPLVHVGPEPPPDQRVGVLWYDTSEEGIIHDIVTGGGSVVDGNVVDSGTGFPLATDCPATGLSYEAGLRPYALNGLRCSVASFPTMIVTSGLRPDGPVWSDHTLGNAFDFAPPNWNTSSGKKLGWNYAIWMRTYASNYRVKYIIWDGQIWYNDGSGDSWKPYTPMPGVPINDSTMHYDHVHVSFQAS